MTVKNVFLTICMFWCFVCKLTLFAMGQEELPKLEVVKFPCDVLGVYCQDYSLKGIFSHDGTQFLLGDSKGGIFHGETNPVDIFDCRLTRFPQRLVSGVDTVCFDAQQRIIGALASPDVDNDYMQIVVRDVVGTLYYQKNIANNYEWDLEISDLAVMGNLIVYFQENDLFIDDLQKRNDPPTVIRECISLLDYGHINKLRAVDEHRLLILADQAIMLFDIFTHERSLVSLAQLGYNDRDAFDLYIVDAEYLFDGRIIVSTNIDISMFCYNLDEHCWQKLSTLCSYVNLVEAFTLRKHYNRDMFLAFGHKDELCVDGSQHDCLRVWFDVWPFKKDCTESSALSKKPSEFDYAEFVFDKDIRILDASWTVNESILVLCAYHGCVHIIKIVLHNFTNNLSDVLLNRELTGKRFPLRPHGVGTAYLSKRHNNKSFLVKFLENGELSLDIRFHPKVVENA